MSRLTTRAGRCASHVHGVAPCFPTGCGEINELLGDDQQPDDPDLALLHQGGAHPSTRAVLDPRHEGELGRVVSFHRAGLALVPPRSNIAPTCARLVPLRRGTPICVLSTRRTRPESRSGLPYVGKEEFSELVKSRIGGARGRECETLKARHRPLPTTDSSS